MPHSLAQPFACHGGEKMLYDVRMGPQALVHDDVLYVCYLACPNEPDGPVPHPCTITCNLGTREWSDPVQIGECRRYDHHYAPVMWMDRDERIHVLADCHGESGRHTVAAAPRSIEQWRPAPGIAKSISYPHVLPMADGELVLYYRALGHMGYWGYQASDDGGWSWSPMHTLVDMDQDPQTLYDCWAGSYQTVCASRDRRSLHIGFAYLDEQRRRNPLYKRTFRKKLTINRYHLYYVRADVASGDLYTIEGQKLALPANREEAEAAKIWDTGHRLTNQPSIWVDEDDEPSFLLPVTGETPWDCQFTFVRRDKDGWAHIPVAQTNSTWCGSMLRGAGDGVLKAYCASGKDDGELRAYGGGDLEIWTSTDAGSTWQMDGKLDPEPGLLYNNPRPAERASGEVDDDFLLFFGWEGPLSLQQDPVGPQARNRGRAFAWREGEWL